MDNQDRYHYLVNYTDRSGVGRSFISRLDQITYSEDVVSIERTIEETYGRTNVGVHSFQLLRFGPGDA